MPVLSALGRKPAVVGELYPAEYGKYVLAVLSKAVALAKLGRTAEAKGERDRARKMLGGPLARGAQKFDHRIKQFLKTLDAVP
jgi:hypothetical protein